MSGRVLPGGSGGPWSGGAVHALATCVLAPNPSPWTLDGTNTWIIGDEQRAIVVDPGPLVDAHLDAIEFALGGREHIATVLTHGHRDHSASAEAFYQRTAVPVRALDPEHRYGAAGMHAGDVIDGGDWHIEVVATPGHSADSVCFFIPQAELLLTGDTVLGRGTTAIIWPEGRLDDYLTSLEHLAHAYAGAQVLLPGHGPTLVDPAAVLQAYIAHRHDRLDEVRAAYHDGAHDVPSLVAAVYGDVPTDVIPAATLSLRAQVQYLVDRGELPAQVAD